MMLKGEFTLIFIRFNLPGSCIYSPSDRGNLPNGHTSKDSPFERSSPVANSTQATSIESSDPSVPNGVNLPYNQEAYSRNSTEKNLRPLLSDEVVAAPLSENSEIYASEVSGVDRSTVLITNNVKDPTLSATDPIVLNEQTETPEVSQMQVEEHKEPEDQYNITQDPEAEVVSVPEPEKCEFLGGPDQQAKLESEIQTQFRPQAEITRTEGTSRDSVEAPGLEKSVEADDKMDVTATLAVQDTTDLPHHSLASLPEGTDAQTPVNPASPISATAPENQEYSDHPSTLNDQAMEDAPSSPSKVARERDEDDINDEPATKRTRTDGDGIAAPEFKVPVLPGITTHVESAQSEDKSLPITKPQQKFMLRVLQNIKRLNDAAPFQKPVDVVALNIPNYHNVVTKPMDLRTMEEKLKGDQYVSVEAYINDFNQIEENSVLFNGLDHVVTKNAQNIKASFDKQMSNLPGPAVTESVSDNKKKKGATALPMKAPGSRRESRSSLPGSARSPVTAASPSTTFALGPQGVPLIRRDSTATDGRPKREIHPPPPRDLPYANQKPKKKKYQWELKFCQTVLSELKKPKHHAIAFPFLLPVDPVALNIPHYHKLIKHPMDLSTIGTKLEHGQYENAKEFEADVRLMFQNCYKFNPSADPVHTMGKQFEAVFDEKWAEKASWVEANTPGSGPQSPGSSPEPDDEDDDEEDDEEEEEENELTKLQQQIAAMSRQVELITKKKKTPPATTKKNKGGKAAKEKSKKSAHTAPAKAEKKTSKPAKKEKTPYVTYEQKQDISNRINSLSETRMATALKIIRDNMPNLKVRP